MTKKYASQVAPINSYGLKTIFIVLGALSLIVTIVFMYVINEYVFASMGGGEVGRLNFILLPDSIRLSIYYSLFGMWIIFSAVFLIIHFKIVLPITRFVDSFSEFELAESSVSSIHGTGIKELDTLAEDFSKMMGAISEERARLHSLSISDPLTELLNRRGFENRLESEISRTNRTGKPFSIILIDLDNFKLINDTYGHHAGDYALIQMSQRIKGVLRNSDAVARVGGDEFLAIIHDAGERAGVTVAQKLHESINSSRFNLAKDGDQRMGYVTASIGVAVFPDNGNNEQEIRQAVDAVLYKAKRAGKNCVVSLGQSSASATTNAGLLKTAIEGGAVRVAYQPIVTMESGQVFAYEVLARLWENDTFHDASEFIELAVDCGLGKELDLAVFKCGLGYIDSLPPDNLLFFNMSSSSLMDNGFMLNLVEIVTNKCVQPSRIIFEITEREVIPDPEKVCGLMSKLGEYGFRFALDDFGSGFSTFSYLQWLKVDFIKIDGGFIRSLSTSQTDRHIVESIQVMANKFGVKTVAEYVEDMDTISELNEIGVSSGQGYFFGKPEIKVNRSMSPVISL